MEASADLDQEIALLANEAVHVAQGYFEDIGESDPSDEFEAYVVQGITQHLVGEHLKWRDKQSAKNHR